MGPADIVQAWAARFALLGIEGRIYPQRRGDGLRWYGTIDDRYAAGIVDGLQNGSTLPVKAGRGRRTDRA